MVKTLFSKKKIHPINRNLRIGSPSNEISCLDNRSISFSNYAVHTLHTHYIKNVLLKTNFFLLWALVKCISGAIRFDCQSVPILCVCVYGQNNGKILEFELTISIIINNN